MPYDPSEVEPRWQQTWKRDRTLCVRETHNGLDTYVLDMFPNPSGPLHMGHCKNYAIGDVVTRYRIRKGENVFHPMGWDAFGLPGEIAALQAGVHPRDWTLENIRIEKEQFDKLGIHYDWDHEVCSCDPEYYRWNQWLFLKLYENGLAYREEAPVNWCPACRTTLANEEVVEDACERCSAPVEAKPMQQWFLKVTAYADALVEGLNRLPGWPQRIRRMQRNWIGREEGSDGSAASYRLRDWCISRQRYWGTPIPIVYCASCGVVPVPEADLPVRLPDMDDFAPKGESPLASVPEFAHTICPTCGGPARRKCDTMTGFVCSSWYFLRFTSPNEADRPFDPEAAARWLPVTQYVGGKEHAVGHLLYARFVTRFLQDIGWVDFEEPFTRLYNQGVVHKDGDKMSKSKGNAVSVDAMVETYGADAARVFALFAAPPDGDVAWNEAGIEGIHRFLSRVWRAVVGEEESAADAQSGGADGIDDPTALNRCTHRAIKAVTEDLERMSYNTAISRLMELTTAILQTVRKDGGTTGAARVAREAVVSMLAPFAPHISEELWHRMGKTGSVHRAEWPAFDAALAEEEKAEIVVQIDGRVRDRFEAEVGTTAEELEREAMGRERIRSLLEGKEVRRVVVVPNSLVNVVTG